LLLIILNFYQEYSAKQINDIYQKLGWEDKGQFLERLLRSHVIKYSSYFELDDAIEKAKAKFEEYLDGKKYLFLKYFVNLNYIVRLKLSKI
jgi:aminopeptidase N